MLAWRYLIGCGVLAVLAVMVAGALAIGVVIGVSRSAGTNSSAQSPVQTPDTTPSATSSKASQPAKKSSKASQDSKEYTVGDTAKLSDRRLQVNDVERNFVPSSQFQRPQQGNEYVRVNLTLTNTSNGTISFNAFDFNLQDPSGVQKHPDLIQEIPDSLNQPSNLAAGGKLNGNLVFQAPQGAAELKLVYKPISMRGDTITFNL